MVKIIPIRKFKEGVYISTVTPKVEKIFLNRTEVRGYKSRLNRVLGKRENVEVELHYKEV